MNGLTVGMISTAVIRRYGGDYQRVVIGIINRARDRQRWDKMVLWSRVLCRARIIALSARAHRADLAPGTAGDPRGQSKM